MEDIIYYLNSRELVTYYLNSREGVTAYVTLPEYFGDLVIYIGSDLDPTVLSLTTDDDLLTIYG